jgi:hypothetical protein
VTVNVTLLPTGRLRVLLIQLPLPLVGAQEAPPDGTHVQVVPLSCTGNVLFNTAPVTAFGPTLLTVTVYTTDSPATTEATLWVTRRSPGTTRARSSTLWVSNVWIRKEDGLGALAPRLNRIVFGPAMAPFGNRDQIASRARTAVRIGDCCAFTDE